MKRALGPSQQWGQEADHPAPPGKAVTWWGGVGVWRSEEVGIMSGQGGRAERARLQSSQMEEPLEAQCGQRGSVNTHRVPEEGSP